MQPAAIQHAQHAQMAAATARPSTVAPESTSFVVPPEPTSALVVVSAQRVMLSLRQDTTVADCVAESETDALRTASDETLRDSDRDWDDDASEIRVAEPDIEGLLELVSD